MFFFLLNMFIQESEMSGTILQCSVFSADAVPVNTNFLQNPRPVVSLPGFSLVC